MNMHCNHLLSKLKYTSLFSLLISVIVLSKFCDCQDICENRELATYENVISENGSYKYVSIQSDSNAHTQSHHYYYSRKISQYQTYPIVSDNFKKFSTNQDVEAKFSLKYYGINVTRFEIHRGGYIRIFGEKYIGYIFNNVYGDLLPENEMVENNDFIAVKWYYEIRVGGTNPH
uniref:Uncharacterized protein n=1 Tax=Schistosoma haematobium TaxID=6185 RepID=A0A095A2E6_SCHHA